MQINRYSFLLFCLITTVGAQSQSSFLTQQSKHLPLLDRLEIQSGKVSDNHFSGLKPYDRQLLVAYTQSLFDTSKQGTLSESRLSRVDQFNLNSFYGNHLEWMKEKRESYASKRPVLKKFYQTPAHFLAHYGKDYFITVDPLIQARLMQEQWDNRRARNRFINQRGLMVRGGVGEKIGFAVSASDVQERGPLFYREWVDSLKSVPGANFFKSFKTDAVDFIDARGYFTFRANSYIRFQAGYDRNFIGNGYRSLLLSDFSGNQLFVKINTRFWKLNYQNLFLELHAGAANNSVNNIVPRKYAAMHHLSMNVTPWLNVGLFEAVIFGRTDRYEFGYLNPVIFLRSVEGNLGSKDNALVGTDFRMNVLKKTQVYGQLMLDEFNFRIIRQQSDWWGNKNGIQLGVKYIDVASIKNLDLQLEYNRVRPFTYSHFDSVSNYAHYNQPLAHPLGANFKEYIALLHYQPLPRLTLQGRVIYWQRGLDSSAKGYNAGANIFRLSGDGRNSDYGYNLLGGVQNEGLNAQARISYEVKENIFIDFHALYRSNLKGNLPIQKSLVIGGGFRMNLWFREYDY